MQRDEAMPHPILSLFLISLFLNSCLVMPLSSSFLGKTLRPRPCSRRSFVSGGRRTIATRSIITMMPEGPEVRTLVDQLQGGVGRRLLDVHFVSGRYVQHGKPDGFEEFAATMTPFQGGQDDEPLETDMILSWQAKGKFIYIILDNGCKAPPDDDDFQRSIWITLGMTGKFVSERIHEENSLHGRWYLEVLDTAMQRKNKLHYHDTRNFGTMKLSLSKDQLDNKLESLGPDILDSVSTTEDVFVEIVAKKSPEVNVCKFLMDQANICGVGNYILADGLYRASIDPFATLKEIDEEEQRRLFRELQNVALESYAAQGMTRQKGGVYANVDGSKGQFEMKLQCYGRQICPKGNLIIKDTNGPHGRTIWYSKEQLIMPLHERFPPSASTPSEPSSSPAPTRTNNMSCLSPTPDRQQQQQQQQQKHDWDILNSSAPTQSLLSSLTDPGWKTILSEIAKDNVTFQSLATFLQQEIATGKTVYPPHGDLFSALNLCPLEKVKVVVVGQDPYHGPGQGHGLAFSVRKGVPPPPSLKNIFSEAMDDVGIDAPQHGNLEHWAKQGVLLLNSVLTVRRGEANSHAKKGWEEFTDFIIEYLNTEKEGLVFLLFGTPAQKKAGKVDDTKHVLIKTSHPSPLGARKTASPFLGSKCFSRCNEALEEQGKAPIDWNVR